MKRKKRNEFGGIGRNFLPQAYSVSMVEEKKRVRDNRKKEGNEETAWEKVRKDNEK